MASHPRWQQVTTDAAEVYERQLVPGMFAPWAPRLLALAGVRPGERVLDIACGTGVVTRLAAVQVGEAGRVVGLDSSPAMLAVACALPAVEGAAIEWLEASALATPLRDAAFDVVLCQHGLQQITDRVAALREMRRVLVSGGRLAVSVWSSIEGSPGMAALVSALERHVSPEAANNRRLPFALGDANGLRRLIVDAGFCDVRVHTLVETARFPSAEAFVGAQLDATPLSTLGALTGDIRRTVALEVGTALGPYLLEGSLAVPLEAHVVLARA